MSIRTIIVLSAILGFFSGFIAVRVATAATPAPVYTVSKVADSQTVEPTDNVGYTIEASVENTGLSYILQDPLPNGYAWFLDRGDDRCVLSTNQILCRDVSQQNPLSIHVSGIPLAAHACGDFANIAVLRLLGVNVASDSAVIHVNCPAELHIVKSFGQGSVALFAQQTALITVFNTGDHPSAAFDVQDPLPEPGIRWFIYSQTGMACSITKDILTCHGEGVAGHEQAGVAISGAPTQCGDFLNYSALLAYAGTSQVAPQVGFNVPCPATPTPTATATPRPTVTAIPTEAPATPTPTRVAPLPPATGDSQAKEPDRSAAPWLFFILGVGAVGFGVGGVVAYRRYKRA